ncbi:MAG: ACR3 family arsenite efflux transporter [Candidatus Hodarchaeales archaeon]|jgi:ACR3 family arsenite transporter
MDRFLPLWILLAIVAGIVLGFVEGIQDFFNAMQIGTTSIPIAIGLLWMMYPVLAKVKYEELSKIKNEGRMFSMSLFLNWIIGPILMFILAWIFLPDLPGFREGIIIIGLARCIAMVLIWNMLAGGDNEDCAVLVALNSLFQVLFYSIYAYFFLVVVSQWLGTTTTTVNITMIDIAVSVFIFLGIPLIAGAITRGIGLKLKGKKWYDEQFSPRLGSTAIIGLLFTIVVMFSMQGENIIGLGWNLVRVALPLTIYFILMFVSSYLLSWLFRFTYDKTVTLSFTAASNNFELAIAVAVGTPAWGIGSDQAIATVVGPLIEVPVLISLVYVSLWLRKYFFSPEGLAKKFGKTTVH